MTMYQEIRADQVAKVSGRRKNPLKSKFEDFTNFIIQRQEQLGVKNIELNSELGFKSPNVIAMVRQGKCRLPVASLAKTAKLLEVDLRDLLFFYLEEYEPDLFDVFWEVKGEYLTDDEILLVLKYREFKKENKIKSGLDFEVDGAGETLNNAFKALR